MMPAINFEDITIRQVNQGDAVPYELLLLADPSKTMIDAYLQDSEIYMAELNNAIIAVYVLTPVNDDHTSMEIKNIAVDTTFQNGGLGKYLLADAAERAKEKGFTNLIIGTANSGIGQIYLYQQQGFEIIEIRKDFFIKNYSEPIYENGILAKHMLILKKTL